MKRFEIAVEETIKYNHSYTISLPEDVDDECVWDEINECDSKDDIFRVVKEYGGKVIEVSVDMSGDVTLEIDDVVEIEEEEEGEE